MILANKTYKRKFYIISVFFVLLFIVIYNISISKTVDEIKKFNDLSNFIQIYSDIDNDLLKLENELMSYGNQKKIDSVYKTVEFHEYLLNIVSEYCKSNRIKLTEFPQVHVFFQNDIEVCTYNFSVEGGFIPLLKLLYQLEMYHRKGKVTSVSFISENDRRTKQKKLTMKTYLQNIKSE